jgi:hypothetical protein
MASIELGGALKALKVERAKVHSDLAKLDKAILLAGKIITPAMFRGNRQNRRKKAAGATLCSSFPLFAPCSET